MARVFLSYAREDLKRARTVAAALEKSGHSVWWDRQLVGGSEYSTAIDAALTDADAVVVLWSKTSVASPWVRDEAAKGRDTGRLVPATIDGAEPPLGFRQFHTIDLSKGRSGGGLRELEAAISGKAGDWPGAPAKSADERRAFGLRPVALVAALALLAVALVLGWRHFTADSSSDRQLALAVMPFADMSQARDQSHIGEGIAEEIMTLVSGTPGMRVIGRTSAWQLNEQGIETVREKLGATHLLEGSVRTAGEELRIAARLIATESGEELWSEEYRRPLSAIFAVQEEIGSSVAQRLRGTVAAAREARKARSIRTSPEVYDLYLAARAVGRRRDYESQLQAEQLLEQALAIDPDYAPAHAYLAITLEIQDNQNPAGPDQNRPEDVARALSHANRAVELAPDHPESHLARGMALDDRDLPAALAALERGKELDPSNFYAWNISGIALNKLCRYTEATENFRRAAQIEPLLHVPHSNLMDSLIRAGKTAEAEQLVERFAARRADPPRVYELRGELLYSTGRLGESFRQFEAAAQAGLNSPSMKLQMGRLLRRFGGAEEAIAALPEAHQRLVGAYWRGDYPAAAAHAESVGVNIWNMPGLPAVAAKAMVEAGRNEQLVRLAERRWGVIAKLARDPGCRLDEWGPSLVLALRGSGRSREAQALLDATKAEYRHRIRNGVADHRKHTELAAILVLDGRHEAAVGELEKAGAMGWLDQDGPYYVALDDPVFRPLRSHPRFQALSQRIARTIEQQKKLVLPRAA